MTLTKKLLPLLLAGAAGCGDEGTSSSGSMLGTWRGDVPGMTLTIDLKNQLRDASGSEVVQGVISSSHKRCLSNAMISGLLTNTTVQMIAIGAGTASQATSVEISGELAGGEISGQFSIDGDDDVEGCELTKAPLRLKR